MRSEYFTVERISTVDAFLGLESIWNELLSEGTVNEPYLTFQWQFSWWRNFGGGNELYILLVKRNDKIHGIAPFMLRKVFTFNIIEFIGTGWSDFLNFIIGDNDREVLGAIINYLADNKDCWDMVLLSDMMHHLGAESKLLKLIEKFGLSVSKREYYICPFVPIKQDYASFLTKKSKNFKKYIKYNKRTISKLGQMGEINIVCVDNENQEAELLTTLCDIERRSWKWKERTNHLRSEAIKNFFSDVFRAFWKRGWARIWLLKIDNKSIAYLISFCYNKRVYLYLQAYDDQYKNSGSFLHNHVIEMAFREGFSGVELLRGESTQKQRWTSYFRQTDQIIIYKRSIISSVAFLSYSLRWRLARYKVFHRLRSQFIKYQKCLKG